MKIFFSLFLAAIMVLSCAMSGFAADMPVKSAAPVAATMAAPVAASAPVVQKTATPGTYPAGPIQKAERGFMNAVYGWTEIPKRIVDKTKETNPIKGVFLGAWQGSCKAFARTASGLSELATFPIGRYDSPQVIADMPAAK